MTYGTPLPRGIAKRVPLRMNYSDWEGGKHSPWWSDTLTLLLKGSNLQR